MLSSLLRWFLMSVVTDDLCLVDRLKASIQRQNTMRMSWFVWMNLPKRLSSHHRVYLSCSLVRRCFVTRKGCITHLIHLTVSTISIGITSRLYPQVFNYYSGLINLRKAHPAFRLGKADLVRKHLEFLPVQDCLVAFCLKDHAGGDKWKNIYVILNANKELHTVNIP